MRISRILSIGLATIAASLVFASAARADALDDIISRGTVRVAIDITAAPFGFQDDQGKPDGADVATAELLAKDLGVKLQIVPVTSANRIAYLQSGRVDLTMSSLSISPERAKAIAFSNPYGVIRAVVLAPKDVTIKSPQDLVGKKISVTRGTTNETDIVAVSPPGTDIVRFNDEASSINALASGQVDAYATGEPLAAPLIKRFPDRHYEAKLVLRNSYYAVGVRRDQPGLLQWVNTWVFFHVHNGDIGKIYKKYVGSDLPELPAL
jgi:polar amino acid transport system substrate-binding protein